MRIFLRVLGIILIVLSLLLLIVSLPAGIIGIILGVFCIIRSIKKYADKITASIENLKNRSGQTSGKQNPLSANERRKQKNSMYQEWEERHKDETDTEIGNTFYIEYEDMDGNFSERYIKIKNVLKKGNITYIVAYCYLQVDERTFRADRILCMMDKPGQEIKDIETFLAKEVTPSLND